ncbi:MAG: putative Ig domain-containing protein, partial [Blastocatellia bacterium]
IGAVTFTFTGTLPNGLTLVNGVLSGTPTQTGPFAIEITATDSNGCSVFEDIGVPVGCPGVVETVSPGTVPSGTVNTPYPAVTFTTPLSTSRLVPVGVLPLGMTFSSGNPLTISGTPTETGVFPFTVMVEDQNGCAGETNYLLAISCAATEITVAPGTVPPGTAGSAYSAVTFSASGGTGSYSLMFAGALPVGMTYSNGVLSGTPSQSGTFEFTVAALDASGCAGATTYSLGIGCPTITVSPGSLNPGTSGVAYPSVTFSQTGGVGTVTFTESGTLPTGITFSSGVLSGTPTQTGSFPITVTAADSDGCTGTASYTLVIGCQTITVNPSSIPAGTAGTAYANTPFTDVGGLGATTFSESGGLPAGMILSGGVLSGTPTQTGSFPIAVTATDSNGCTGSRSYTLVINCLTITVNPSTIAAGTGGVAYSSTTFTQTGGVGTITFSQSGTLPSGMTFSGGILSGIPTQTGSFPISVTAT